MNELKEVDELKKRAESMGIKVSPKDTKGLLKLKILNPEKYGGRAVKGVEKGGAEKAVNPTPEPVVAEVVEVIGTPAPVPPVRELPPPPPDWVPEEKVSKIRPRNKSVKDFNNRVAQSEGVIWEEVARRVMVDGGRPRAVVILQSSKDGDRTIIKPIGYVFPDERRTKEPGRMWVSRRIDGKLMWFVPASNGDMVFHTNLLDSLPNLENTMGGQCPPTIY